MEQGGDQVPLGSRRVDGQGGQQRSQRIQGSRLPRLVRQLARAQSERGAGTGSGRREVHRAGCTNFHEVDPAEAEDSRWPLVSILSQFATETGSEGGAPPKSPAVGAGLLRLPCDRMPHSTPKRAVAEWCLVSSKVAVIS